MQDEDFATEFERQRNEIVESAFGLITLNVERAVVSLLNLLDSKDERIRRLVSNDLINHFLKRRELVNLGERIGRIEKQLETR